MPEQPESPSFSSKMHTVCGREMTTAPENYFPTEYQGRIIYFCTSFCLDAFNADPERFYAAHSQKKSPNFDMKLQSGQTTDRQSSY